MNKELSKEIGLKILVRIDGYFDSLKGTQTSLAVIKDKVMKIVGGELSKNGGIVNKGVCEQIKWERDEAIRQLDILGYEFGEEITYCEWLYDGYRRYHTSCGHMLHKNNFSRYKYCPYCGKQLYRPKKHEHKYQREKWELEAEKESRAKGEID